MHNTKLIFIFSRILFTTCGTFDLVKELPCAHNALDETFLFLKKHSWSNGQDQILNIPTTLHGWWVDIMTILVFDGHLQLSIFMISNGFYNHDHNLQLHGKSYKSHSNM